jgi:hypothetical protein
MQFPVLYGNINIIIELSIAFRETRSLPSNEISNIQTGSYLLKLLAHWSKNLTLPSLQKLSKVAAMHSIKKASGGQSVSYDLFPDFFPVCHRSAHIILKSATAHEFKPETSREETLQLLFQCPSMSCKSQFLVEYVHGFHSKSGTYLYQAKNIYPKIYKSPEISEGIADLSPNFVKILNQAAQAESNNLNEICGLGYRKAVEFLVKDYCIQKNPKDDKKIRAMLLGQCIADYVNDTNIKACVERATWLGNDEAHYERRWTAHDISDLKMLIKLAQLWISGELLTAKYLAEMGKKIQPPKTQ